MGGYPPCPAVVPSPTGFSVELNGQPLHSSVKFTVLPYCPAVHGPDKDRDYLLFSDGVLYEVKSVAGLDAEPEVPSVGWGWG